MIETGFRAQGFFLSDLIKIAQELCAREQKTILLQTLTIASQAAFTQTELIGLAKIILDIPITWRTQTESWAQLSAKIFCQAGKNSELHAFLQCVPSTFRSLGAYQVWDLLKTNAYQAVLDQTQPLLETLHGYELGLVQRAKACALFELHQAGWQEAFEIANKNLNGSSLGRSLMDQGRCLEQHGEHIAAQGCWAQALAIFKKDVWQSARLYFNLGLSFARQGLPEAEAHFFELKRLSQRAEASDFRARATTGLALARRALGEYQRAEFAYRQATQFKDLKDDDKQEAYRGLGHTLRLMGALTEALKELEVAARCVAKERESQTSWVFADLAATHLQRGDVKAASLALQRTGTLRGEDADRASIVRAELARLKGDANQALQELSTIKIQSLWAREESRCFPDLFALAKLMNQPVPTPMTITTRTRIDIHVLGVMRVQVNGRSIPLKPTGRAAEVLALLLRHGHRMALDQMLERIYPDKTSNREKQRKALWTIVQQLRQSLGWQDSIVALGGAYELSEQAQWHVHPNSFVNIAPQERYLDGIHSEWVLEVNQEIQNQTPRQLN